MLGFSTTPHWSSLTLDALPITVLRSGSFADVISWASIFPAGWIRRWRPDSETPGPRRRAVEAKVLA